jgi:hypothetical protein
VCNELLHVGVGHQGNNNGDSGGRVVSLTTIATIGSTTENLFPGGIGPPLTVEPPQQPHQGHEVPHGERQKRGGSYTTQKRD